MVHSCFVDGFGREPDFCPIASCTTHKSKKMLETVLFVGFLLPNGFPFSIGSDGNLLRHMTMIGTERMDSKLRRIHGKTLLVLILETALWHSIPCRGWARLEHHGTLEVCEGN